MPSTSESIAAYVAAQTAVNDQQDAAVDTLVSGVSGVTADVQFLNDTIAKLQNSPGELTPADQASLDALQARGKATADKLAAVSQALTDLDNLTNPTPPAGVAAK